MGVPRYPLNLGWFPTHKYVEGIRTEAEMRRFEVFFVSAFFYEFRVTTFYILFLAHLIALSFE